MHAAAGLPRAGALSPAQAGVRPQHQYDRPSKALVQVDRNANWKSVFRIRLDPYHMAGSGSTVGNVDLDPGSKEES